MQRKLPVLLIIFVGLLSTLTGILINVTSNSLPPFITPYLRYSWPLLGAVVLITIILSVWQYHIQSNTRNSRSTASKYHRQSLIERVQRIWIKGILEQSLHGAVLIALGLRERRDAVKYPNPWRLVLEKENQPLSSLPPGTPIEKVFDDSNRELLILGEPGSGKTTLLLELARILLKRAVQDESQPIPVVFNLSSWAAGKSTWSVQNKVRQKIDEWLEEELINTYFVSQKVAKEWITDDRILLLLDGLDEVAEQHRKQCIEEINAFRKIHGSVPIVICSRRFDYFAQSARLLLTYAVIVQPLTDKQIDEYLLNAGNQLTGLRKAMQGDHELKALARTPLMLSILTLAYYGKAEAEIQSGNNAREKSTRIFTTYVQRMLQIRNAHTHYLSQYVIRHLGWLAQHLEASSQTEFYLNKIQPDWLANKRIYRLYQGISMGAINGLRLGLLAGCICSIYFVLKSGLIAGFIAGIISLLVTGFLFGLISFFIIAICKKGIDNIALPDRKTDGLLLGLIVGLATSGSSFFIAVMTNTLLATRIDLEALGIINILFVGTLLSLFFGLIFNSGIYLYSAILKLFLCLSGSIPWNYTRLLDYAADHILLRKVGNGYIFIHRQLLDYFMLQYPEYKPIDFEGDLSLDELKEGPVSKERIKKRRYYIRFRIKKVRRNSARRRLKKTLSNLMSVTKQK